MPPRPPTLDKKTVSPVSYTHLDVYKRQGLSLDGCPPRYGVPVILTAGERDWTTPYPLAAAYYDTLSAPCKAFLSLPNAGHLPFRERPEEWSHILLDALAQI